MTRKILIVAFTLLCVFQINGQNGYERSPLFYRRVERTQGFTVKDAGKVADEVILNKNWKINTVMNVNFFTKLGQ